MSDEERSDTEPLAAGQPAANDEGTNDDAAPAKVSESKAAAKRKKKKEKEKAKKQGQEVVASDAERSDTEEPKSLDTAGEANDENDAKEDEDVKDEATEESKSAAKRKKDKKKEKEKKEKEKKAKDEDKDVKKKGNKHADLIREMLRKREEAEAEAKRQVEEEERRLEGERLARERDEKLALERKEEDKRRKAELIAKQKREGTYLTKKQKQDMERARASLLHNQNIVVPIASSGGTVEGGEKPKKPYYGKKKPAKKAAGGQPPAVEGVATPEPKSPEPVEPSGPEGKEEEVEEEIVDDWEQIVEAVDTKSPQAKSPSADKPVQRATQKLGKLDAGQEDASSGDESDESESSAADEESIDTSSMAQTTSKETREELFTRVRARIAERRTRAEAKRDSTSLRSPVICVLGHVDTGKTKMLDTIRRTHVQDSEAGGITQQIGATRVPAEAIKERCRMVKKFDPAEVKIPGFLIIDTPGHESFANLRTRGSSLCDIAILVVDLMHGLEPQAIESLKLLKDRKTPFVVALNKIDRLYGYESNPRKDIWHHMTAQAVNTQMEYKDRYETIRGEFAEQGINIASALKNKDFREYVSVVPTSAMNGDGIGNLMAHLVEQSQTRLAKKLIFSDELDCTVMEVRSLPGLGTTIDVILVNGTLHVNDAIVLTGTEGAIVTSVRDLLMPQPLKEIRVKNEYEHYKEIKGAQGVKVLAKYLDKTVAGLPLYVAHNADEIDVLREDAEEQLQRALMSINKRPEGVYVQASTLGSLEALLTFLDSQKIPYSNVNIGPVHKLDVQKSAAMLEHNPEFACILAFDVPVDKDVQLAADREGVRIFQADIIYHLEDSFLKYREELRERKKKENEHLAIFPCKLQVLPQHIFNARNPIVCGVRVDAGTVRKGTPIVAHTPDGVVFLGSVSSIERNHDQVDSAKAGEEVCIKIENTTGEAPKLYGRHFTHTDALISRITRESIDVCKTYFRDDLSKADWQLVIQLKRMLGIV